MFLTDAQTVKYHQQDNESKCGEAVAQMLLAFLNGDTKPKPQKEIFLNGAPHRSPNVVFSTSPSDLAALLNTFQVPPSQREFQPHIDPDLARAVGRIVSSLQQAKLAVPVMVFKKLHWILVCNALLEPVNGTTRVRGFFVHNPWPLTPARKALKGIVNPPTRPFPHQADDACGNFDGHPTFGIANEYVTSAAWRCCYAFAPAEIGDEDGFVSVTTEPKPGSDPLEIPGPSTGRTAPQDDQDRVKAANAALAAENLQTVGPLASALQGAQFTSVLAEVEVEDIETPGTSYYCVALKRGTIPFAGVALFDAGRGDFWGLRVYGSNAPPGAGFPTADMVQAALQRDSERLTTRFGAKVADATIEKPRFKLVWTPSKETRSPFMPVARIQPSGFEADAREAPLFVTATGSVVHGNLTTEPGAPARQSRQRRDK